MIDLNEVLSIHSILIDEFGGASGVRDLNLLESAINRPYATFDGQELYPGHSEKAAALLESILINHPFVDGNKRTGYVLMRLLLMQMNFDIIATQEDKYQFVIEVAEGRHSKESITLWISEHLVKKF